MGLLLSITRRYSSSVESSHQKSDCSRIRVESATRVITALTKTSRGHFLIALVGKKTGNFLNLSFSAELGFIGTSDICTSSLGMYQTLIGAFSWPESGAYVGLKDTKFHEDPTRGPLNCFGFPQTVPPRPCPTVVISECLSGKQWHN